MEKVLHARRFFLLPLALFAAGTGAVVLFLFDPSHYSFYPICLFHRVTGLECPGCGATRALFCLAHGRILDALHYNALLVVALPFLVVAGIRLLLLEAAGQPAPAPRLDAVWIKLLLVVIILFTVLRNIPVAPFTYLSPP
jgi:hypothetical protein